MYQQFITIHAFGWRGGSQGQPKLHNGSCNTGGCDDSTRHSSPDWQHFTENKQQAQNGKVASEPPGEGCNYSIVVVDNAPAYATPLNVTYLYGVFPIDGRKSV